MSSAPESPVARLRGPAIIGALIAIVCGILAIWFRGHDGPTGPITASAADGSASKPGEVLPIVDGWPAPAFVLAITGQQHGYIEPCGCSPKQSGGLARRADLFRQLREEKKWSVLGLETGGSLDEMRVTRPQSELKFAMILDALNGMGYRSLGLGTEELKIGAFKLFDIHSNRRVEKDFDLPFVAANVVLLGSPTLETPTRHRVLEINGHKVGVTSIYGSNYRSKLSTLPEDEIQILPPLEVLPETLAAMKKEGAEYFVLMSYSDVEESRQLARKFPEFQLVVSAEGADDPGDEHEFIGQTLFFVSAMKGKYVNVVGVYPGEKPAVRFERIELDQDRFGRSPFVRQLMADYQLALKEAWLDPDSPLRSGAFPHPSGRQFVGVQSCKSCHASAYEVWEGSNHAHATASLLEGRPEEKGTWIDRTYDPECICCHATGWDAQDATPYADGFMEAKSTPHLVGNQCENCHGPASTHVNLETAWKKSGGPRGEALLKAREELHITPAGAEKSCLKCHDFANSPNFKFEDYWPDIEHPTPPAEKSP